MALIIVLQNKSNAAPISNYNYEVLIGDGSKERSTTIASGQVKNHTRTEGWQVLVTKMLEDTDYDG